MSDIKQSNNSDNQNNYQAVYSLRLATALVSDFPYFANLVSVRKSHRNPKHKVWLFKRSPEFDAVFQQLKAEAIKARQDREEEIKAFDKDVGVCK